jgi:hypothetical protein
MQPIFPSFQNNGIFAIVKLRFTGNTQDELEVADSCV